jgi:predicted RNase H-like HicB family nuclease
MRQAGLKRAMKKLQYLVRINKDPESDCGASVPDLPECIAIDIALRRIQSAIALHLRGLQEDGHQSATSATPLRDS